jgi:type IV secretory pathway VirB2 component (pilin)
MAQDAAPSWLEHTLHGNGKINTVVAVVAIIILGLGIWMWRMDRRLRAMETRQRN